LKLIHEISSVVYLLTLPGLHRSCMSQPGEDG